MIAVAITSRRKVGIAEDPPSTPTEPGEAIEEARPDSASTHAGNHAQAQTQRQAVEREPEPTN